MHLHSNAYRPKRKKMNSPAAIRPAEKHVLQASIMATANFQSHLKANETLFCYEEELPENNASFEYNWFLQIYIYFINP